MIPVVLSTDHNFIMPTGVAIFSMLESNKETAFDIFILQNDDVTDEDRDCLLKTVQTSSSRISFINPGEHFSKSYEIRGISVACYYRLLIPWLIPQYDRIIYIDGDIIVKSDISHLFYTPDFEDKLIYGVRTPGFTLDAEYSKYINSINLDCHKYINSGVLVYNGKLIRELNLKEEILSHTDKQYLFQDQDIINIVFKDRIGWLPLKFNRSPVLEQADKNKLVDAKITTCDDFDDAIVNPIIIHYAGPKPWKTFTYHWYDWWSTYSRSPLYDIEYDLSITHKILNPKFTVVQLAKMLFRGIFKL